MASTSLDRPLQESLLLDPQAVGDVTPESLQVLQLLTENLAKEQLEATTARKERDTTLQQLAQEELLLTRERAQQVEKSAAQATAILDEQQSALNRIREIDSSVLLRIIEPVAGLFNENFSRGALARKMRRNQTELNIVSTEDTLNAAKVASKKEELNAERAQAQLKAAAETGDVVDLATLSDILRQQRMDTAAIRQAILARTPDNLLANIAQQVNATDEEVRQIRTARASQEFALRQQVFQDFFNRISQVNTIAEQALDTDLANPEFLAKNNIPPALAQHILLDRQSKRLAVQEQQLRVAAGLTAKKDDDTRQIRARIDALPLDERRKLLEQALKTGTVDIGDGFKATITDLSDSIRQATTRLIDITGSVKSEQMFNEATLPLAQSLGRVLGISESQLADTTLSDVLRTITQAPNTSPQARAQAGIIASQLDAAKALTQFDPETAATLTNTVLANAQELSKQLIEDALSSVPNDLRQATRGFFTTGQIASTQDAATILTAVATVGESTGTPQYDAATRILRERAFAVLSEDNPDLTEAQRTQLRANKILGKVPEPAALITEAINNEAIATAVAAPIIGTAVRDAAVLALKAIGFTGLADRVAVNDPAFVDSDGELSAENIINRLLIEANPQARVADLGALQAASQDLINRFISEVRRQAMPAAEQVTTPRGQQAYVISAYNRALFNNQPVVYLTGEIDAWLNATTKRLLTRVNKPTVLPGGFIAPSF